MNLRQWLHGLDSNNKGKSSKITDAISAQKYLLSSTGNWPQPNPSIFYLTKFYVNWIFDLSFEILLFWELWRSFLDADYKTVTELLSLMASMVSYIIKRFIFDLKSKPFLTAIDKLENPILSNHPKKLDVHIQRTIKMARTFVFAYELSVVNLMLLHTLRPFYSSEKTAAKFSLFDLGKFQYPFHVYQLLCIGVACLNNSAMDLLAMAIISTASAQFKILEEKILNARKWAGLTNDEIHSGKVNPELEMDPVLDAKINQYLGECVKHHHAILDFVADIENIFSYIFLVQFIDSVLATCNTWFQFMLEDKIFKIIYLFLYASVLLIQLGMYCVFGNNLMLASEKLRDACYKSNWYLSNNKVRKSLILIMERTKRPSMLTAGKFSYLNLATFMGLLKMSYSYFALMNHLYG